MFVYYFSAICSRFALLDLESGSKPFLSADFFDFDIQLFVPARRPLHLIHGTLLLLERSVSLSSLRFCDWLRPGGLLIGSFPIWLYLTIFVFGCQVCFDNFMILFYEKFIKSCSFIECGNSFYIPEHFLFYLWKYS